MAAEQLKKYLWLIRTFVRAGKEGLTLKEIGARWEDRFGTEYPRRTFNNHRDAIAELFGIEIECNRSANRYFIGGYDDIQDTDSETAWLINTFTVNDILTTGKERLSGRISVENIPSGQKYLTSVMDAMLEGRKIRVVYRKYTSVTGSEYCLWPYALKESMKRWYLVAWCQERESLRVYGLDRIEKMEVTQEEFTLPKDFDVDELFATSFGVYLPEGRPCEIWFKATAREANYLRDLPLHPSQKELVEDEDGVIFSIFACPDESLTMEFMKLGGRAEVILPKSLRDDIASRLREALEQYSVR